MGGYADIGVWVICEYPIHKRPCSTGDGRCLFLVMWGPQLIRFGEIDIKVIVRYRDRVSDNADVVL